MRQEEIKNVQEDFGEDSFEKDAELMDDGFDQNFEIEGQKSLINNKPVENVGNKNEEEEEKSNKTLDIEIKEPSFNDESDISQRNNIKKNSQDIEKMPTEVEIKKKDNQIIKPKQKFEIKEIEENKNEEGIKIIN